MHLREDAATERVMSWSRQKDPQKTGSSGGAMWQHTLLLQPPPRAVSAHSQLY